ncbi:MAG TPA: TadE family protein [Bryobacteraceae bacterium]|nr:TadE family protein [Bryobacteraceae bacterium]
MRLGIRREKRQRGNAIVEFALVVTFLMSLIFGTFSIGMTLTKSVQAGIVSRDAGAMFMRYVDFTLTANKDLLVRLANGMGMTTTGGNGVVIMTQVTKIGNAQCTAGGLTAAQCLNNGRNVVVKRVTVGNTSVYTTTFGSPSASIITSDGSIAAANYLKDASARADAFASVMTLNDGEFAYISEAYFLTPEISLPGYRNNTYVYQRNIF